MSTDGRFKRQTSRWRVRLLALMAALGWVQAILGAAAPAAAAVALFAVVQGCSDPVAASAPHAWFIAIAGQSNAVGGGTDKAREPIADVPYREFVAGKNDYSIVIEHDWEPLATRAGGHHGLEFGFVWAATEAGDGPLAVEKYAVSGTALYRWSPPDGDIYPLALAHLRESQATCPIGRPYDALVWWQGEADGNPVTRAESYGSRLYTFTERLRSDLGLPDLPIVALRLRADSPRQYTAEERASLEADWREARPSVNLVVDLDDLPTKTDNVHYDTPSLDAAGRRVYEALAQRADAR